jgi:predicted MFS family arabinose efflux permease
VLVWLTLRFVPESHDDRSRPLDLAGLTSFGAACFLGTYALIRGNDDGWGSAPILGSLIAAVTLLALFIRIERRASTPMLPLTLFRIPAFTGTALVAFAQSVALYPLFLFLSIYFQDALRLSATGTGLRLLPITLVLFLVAPISGRLTARVPLRLPLVTGLVLIACSLLLMRGVTTTSDWRHLLPGFVIGGLAIGTISPALAAAMVSVLPVERSGLASGINNTFRQLGIAIGIAGLGAIFQHDTARPVSTAAGIVAGLNTVLLVAALTAAAAAVLAWPLLGRQRSGNDV